MSGSHQFYTATGRALPLPPNHVPKRSSSVLRLPTRRYDAAMDGVARIAATDECGRRSFESPHGGDFVFATPRERLTRQLVVYDSTRRYATERSNKQYGPLSSTRASSSVRSSRSSRLEEKLRVPFSHTSNGRRQCTGYDGDGASTQEGEGRAYARESPDGQTDLTRSEPRARRTADASQPADLSSPPPRAKYAAAPAAWQDRNDEDDEDDSPCLDRAGGRNASRAREERPASKASTGSSSYRPQHHPARAAAPATALKHSYPPSLGYTGSESSAADAPLATYVSQQQQQQRNRPVRRSPPTRPPWRPPVSRSSTSDEDNEATRHAMASELQHSLRPASGAHTRDGVVAGRDQPVPAARQQQQQQQQQQRQEQLRSGGPGRQQQQSAGGAAVTASASSSAPSLAASANSLDPRRRRAADGEAAQWSAASAQQPLRPLTDAQRRTPPAPAAPGTPPSQRLGGAWLCAAAAQPNPVRGADEPLPERLSGDGPGSAAARQPQPSSYQPISQEDMRRARVAALECEATPRYSRSPRSHEPVSGDVVRAAVAAAHTGGVLETIPDKVRRLSVSPDRAEAYAGTPNSPAAAGAMTVLTAADTPGALSSASALARRAASVGGTELLPPFPQLQGQLVTNDKERERNYRTIVRFVERQPEPQKRELRKLYLEEYKGREEEFVSLLSEAYGEDFEAMKSAMAITASASQPLTTTPRGWSSNAATPAAADAPTRTSRSLLYGAEAAAATEEPDGERDSECRPEHNAFRPTEEYEEPVDEEASEYVEDEEDEEVVEEVEEEVEEEEEEEEEEEGEEEDVRADAGEAPSCDPHAPSAPFRGEADESYDPDDEEEAIGAIQTPPVPTGV